MRGVDDDHVHTGLGEQFGALFGSGADADRSADQQAAVPILGRIGMLMGLEHVLDGDQATHLAGLVEHQHPLEAMLVHQRARLFEGCRLRAP